MKTYRIEMTHGQDLRFVEADGFRFLDEASGWIVFYRKPPQGGVSEYWRARIDCVVSLETVT